MEKSNRILNNDQVENLPFSQLPKELNQYIFSFFSNSANLAKASLTNKNWHIFNKSTLTQIKKETLNQTINVLSDTNEARKLPINEIEKHVNFLIKIGYKFEAFKALQDIFTDEFNNFVYRDEEADKLKHFEQIKELLLSKFKLAGHINAYFLGNIAGAMCGDEEKAITLATVCAIKILLEDYYEIPAVQEEFELVNKYLTENNDGIIFYKKDGKAYIGPALLDEALGGWEEPAAVEAAKQWLAENGYVLNTDTVKTQTPKPSP